MVITGKFIVIRYSGGAANFAPDSCLGGVMSDTEAGTHLLRNLFDNIADSEASSGDTEYRCYYVFNCSTTETWYTAEVYIGTETPSADTVIDIGLDPAGIGDGVTTGIATTIVNESTAPAGVTFSHPTEALTALVIGNIGPGNGQAIWVRRTVSASASADPLDTVTLKHEGSDTA